MIRSCFVVATITFLYNHYHFSQLIDNNFHQRGIITFSPEKSLALVALNFRHILLPRSLLEVHRKNFKLIGLCSLNGEQPSCQPKPTLAYGIALFSPLAFSQVLPSTIVTRFDLKLFFFSFTLPLFDILIIVLCYCSIHYCTFSYCDSSYLLILQILELLQFFFSSFLSCTNPHYTRIFLSPSTKSKNPYKYKIIE